MTEVKLVAKTQTKWCATHDLNIHQFMYWLRKFNFSDTNSSKNSLKSNWLSIEIDEQTGTRTGFIGKSRRRHN
ncbi:IS66 family insertion sequence element accessory protein TnpA [Neobacillus pocheonensis]|uniref:IS66 family insertion sequence element accessory protein TnpA n=1 Tax=Neobacillus pocheonensis TaxID=363869 RepID=UPI003D29A5CD